MVWIYSGKKTRCIVQKSEIHAITIDIGITIRFLYQVFCENHFPIRNHAIKMIANCPNSTPTLKVKSDRKNLFCGKPRPLKALANPKPCIRPNKKTIIILDERSLSEIIFSSARNIIERAIKGSIMCEGGFITP